MRLLRFRVVLAGIGALPLAGCLTSGTNMHGNFDCRAPGGTCAPMTRIDAAAATVLAVAEGMRRKAAPVRKARALWL